MTEILEALNSYKGDNIWQDVIYGVIDTEATEGRWADENNDHFVGEDGVHYARDDGSMSESSGVYGGRGWWDVPQWRVANDDASGE